MKAIRFLTLLPLERLDLKQCGVVSGLCLRVQSPKAYFGIFEDIPCSWFDDNKYYFFFFGEREHVFRFLPNNWRFFPIDIGTGVYVWEIDD